MPERPTPKFRPDLERLEEKRPLSAGVATAHDAAQTPNAPEAAGALSKGRAVPTRHVSPAPKENEAQLTGAQRAVALSGVKPEFGYLVYRITNPTPFNAKLAQPSSHLLVQTRQPIPGQVYNVLYVAVRNGTSQTFDASRGFLVKFPGQAASFPVLTGDQQWKPGQVFVFYVLTKKYYPVPNVVSSGFQFVLDGARSVAVPGPSGIFLRLKYNPATIDKVLDWIVRFSPGVPGGPAGIKFGLPDTAIYEFVSAKTNRQDFGGYF